MKKLLVAALAAGMVSGLVAQEAAEVEQNDSGYLLEYGVDVDVFSAYVWRNAVQFDRPVGQISPWVDWTVADLFWIGGYVWQNYDLNGGRRNDGFRGEWNETDFNMHIASQVWTSEDEASALKLELGNEWYYYNLHGMWAPGYSKSDDYPTTYEVYLSAEFKNPYVTPYGKISCDYKDVSGLFAEAGLKKESTFADLTGAEADWMSRVSVFGDFNVSFGSSRYLAYLYGEEHEGVANEPRHGIGGATLQSGLAWEVTDWLTLKGVVAFTSVLNGTCRDNVRDQVMSEYLRKTELVWGGVRAEIAF